MNIKAFMEGLKSGKTKEVKLAEADIQRKELEFKQKMANIKILKVTPGYKEFEDFVKNRIELFRKQRDILVPGCAEDLRAQANVNAYTDILSFVDKWAK